MRLLLNQNCPKYCKRPTGGKIYCYQHRSQPRYFALFVLVSIFLPYIVNQIPSLWKGDTIVKTAGVLVPNNSPTPTSTCKGIQSKDIPSNALVLFFGNSVVVATKFPISISKGEEHDFLSIGRNPKGVSISAKIFSGDGRIVAKIDKDEFRVNQNNTFYHKDTKHSLVVYDQKDTTVLDIYYINFKAVRISGVFHFPNQPPAKSPIVIDENGIRFKNIDAAFPEVCMDARDFHGNYDTIFNVGGNHKGVFKSK